MPITKKVNSNANVKQFSDADLQNHITQVAGGSSGGINYINNPGAETDTTGWAAYQNTAQSTPVTGAGGSPNVSISRTTTNPLRGTGSFLFTKDAANRQGQGVSYDFTIDNADKAKVLSIQFDYIVASGTFNAGSPTIDSDIEMWIYDKANAILIPVTPFKLESNSSVDPGTFKGTFQTNSNSTSYRLIFHIATTNASAWSFEFDNVVVGPQAILNAPPVSDWVPYPVTITATISNPTKGTTEIDQGYWRRVGDTMQIRYDYDQTAPGSAGSGVYLFSLPAGYSIDLTKLNTEGAGDGVGVVGFSQVSDQSANTFSGTVLAHTDGQNVFIFIPAGGGVDVGSASFGLGTTSPSYSFEAFLPIVGWSSNTLTGNDADSRVVAFSAQDQSQNVTASVVPVAASSVRTDTHSGYDSGLPGYRVQVSGYYDLRFDGQIQPAGNNAGTTTLTIAVNGSGIESRGNGMPSAGQEYSHSVLVAAYPLKAGDFVQFQVSQNGGTSVTGNFEMGVTKVSGPALPLATEFVGILYYQAVTFAITGSPQTITFSVKSYDTHGAFNPSTGIFTAPVSGKYRIHSKVNVQVTPTSITGAAILGMNNSTDGLSVRVDIEDHKQTASTFSRSLQGSITFNALAGGTINVDVVLSGASGGTLLGGGGDDGYINIEKVD